MDKIKFYLIAGLIAMAVLLALDWVVEPKGEDILVEAHGMLFDIILFGIILAIFDSITEKRTTIRRYQEEIDDFRNWDAEEAKSRIIGNLKRLIRLGVDEFDLSDCYLEKTNMAFLNGKISSLDGTHLSNCDLRELDLRGLNLKKTHLKGANLSGVDLRELNLAEVDLREVNLSGSNLAGADLQGAILDNADLSGADLRGANLLGASLIYANVNEANFTDADLRHVSFLSQEDSETFAKMGIIQFQFTGDWQRALVKGVRFSRFCKQISFTQFSNSRILEAIGVKFESGQLEE